MARRAAQPPAGIPPASARRHRVRSAPAPREGAPLGGGRARGRRRRRSRAQGWAGANLLACSAAGAAQAAQACSGHRPGRRGRLADSERLVDAAGAGVQQRWHAGKRLTLSCAAGVPACRITPGLAAVSRGQSAGLARWWPRPASGRRSLAMDARSARELGQPWHAASAAGQSEPGERGPTCACCRRAAAPACHPRRSGLARPRATPAPAAAARPHPPAA